jgi:hypothetical protein
LTLLDTTCETAVFVLIAAAADDGDDDTAGGAGLLGKEDKESH